MLNFLTTYFYLCVIVKGDHPPQTEQIDGNLQFMWTSFVEQESERTIEDGTIGVEYDVPSLRMELSFNPTDIQWGDNISGA